MFRQNDPRFFQYRRFIDHGMHDQILLPLVESVYYMNVDLYQYYLGRKLIDLLGNTVSAYGDLATNPAWQ